MGNCVGDGKPNAATHSKPPNSQAQPKGNQPINTLTQPNPQLYHFPRSYIEEKVVKDDKLMKVEQYDMRQGFHKCIGALVFKDKFGRIGKGSAVLISKNLILTAAHNIFDKEYNCKHTNFKFYLSAYGIVQIFYQIQNDSWRYPLQFETCQKKNKSMYDYAIMKIKDNNKISIQDKWLPLSIACFKCQIQLLENIKLQIYGYPYHGSLPNYTPKDKQQLKIELYQYGLSRRGQVNSIDPVTGGIIYGISTLPGQSGSPLIVDNKIIGIHIGSGYQFQFFNFGRLLTISFIDNLKKWKKELKGHKFTVKVEQACSHVQLAKQEQYEDEQIPLQICRILEKTQKDEVLDLRGKRLPVIDLTKHPNLKELALSENMLNSINLSNNVQLTQLQLQNNKIKQADFSYNVNLSTLYVSSNQLETIDISHNNRLVDLWLYSNKLITVDLKNLSSLTSLLLSSNQLASIDLSANPNLTHLALSSNQLNSIDLTNNPKVSWLQLNQNKLNSVIFWYSAQLSLIKSGKNMLRTLDIRNQNHKKCQVALLHHKNLQSVCIKLKNQLKEQFRQSKIYQETQEEKINKYGCKYSFVLKIV